MRFAFAGIDFLAGVFEALLAEGWDPVKLFTRPCDGVYDSNDGVLERARQLSLPLQLSRIRPADLAVLGAQGCEALVVAGYPWLIHGWEGHLNYAINIHPSPLPVGRGPYPLFRAILDGYERWGVTAHALDPGFDTGAILCQEQFPLSPAETHETLLAKCQMSARRLATARGRDCPDRWRAARPQSGGSYFPRAHDGQRTLEWSQEVAVILRRIRAFGGVETIADVAGRRIFITAASGWTEPHAHNPGTVLHQHQGHLVVAARDGFVQLTDWNAKALPARSAVP